jgi:flagellar hook-length control protein FliK
MMSAKTVLTETPVATSPTATSSNTGVPAAAGGAPSDFQNLLAGAVAPAEAPVLAPPAQPLLDLLKLKNAQQAALLAGSGAVAQPVKVVKPAVAPVDLLKILNDSATLLPPADAEAVVTEPNTETRDSDEPVAEGDILAEWLDVMLPSSVFVPQAGSASNAGTSGTVKIEGEGATKAPTPSVQLPVSLMQQAGLPEQQETMDTAAPVIQGAAATHVINRDVVATATQNAAAAFATALTAGTEAADTEAPTNDSWMSAMGDLTSKRSSDLAPASEARLPTPVHDARWADALAHRLVLMAREGESVASLKLVPVDLGPLDIQISVRDGEASVHFGAAHAETRAVLESSMPRLRELLSAQGLQLTNSSVSHQSGGQNRPERSATAGSVNAIGEETEVSAAKVVSTSLLDIYA